MLACLSHPSILLDARQECISLHPHPNPLFEVPSPSFALPLPSFPSSIFLSVSLSYLSARITPPPAAARRATDTFIVLLFLTPCFSTQPFSHLPPAQDTDPGTLAIDGAFIHPSAHSSEPPVPSFPHSVTKEWLAQSRTQSSCCEGECFKQGQRESTQVTCVEGKF